MEIWEGDKSPPQSRSSGFRLRGRHPNFRKFSVTAPSAPQKFPFLGLFPRVLGGQSRFPRNPIGGGWSPPPELRLCPLPFRVKAKSGSLPPIAKICDKKAILATPLAPKKSPFSENFPFPTICHPRLYGFRSNITKPILITLFRSLGPPSMLQKARG